MRALLAASAVVLAFAVTPASARDYPWCAKTSASGFNPSCNFTSYNQCMATVSGQRGECVLNPILAFGQQLNPPRKRARHHDWHRRW